MKPTLLWLAIATVWLGCRLDPREHDTPGYCCTEPITCGEPGGAGALHPCADPQHSFCDNHGQFPASDGVGRTCIAEPGGRTCDLADDCGDPAAPVCDLTATQTCVRCEAAADCGRFDGRPLCHPDRGACVECVAATDCPAARPLCDPDGGCRECARNNDCSSQLCNLSTGSCVPDAEVIYVGQNGDGADCTRTDPCGSIQEAIGHVTATRHDIHVSSGTYDERIAIDGVSFFLSSDGGELRAPDAEVGPVVTVTGVATVELDGLRVRDGNGATGDAVDCSGGATLTLRDARLDQNDGLGLDSTGCALTVVASRIEDNAGGGVQVAGGALALRNDFITGNGAPTALVGGVSASGTTTLAIDFNTIADNVAAAGVRAGVQCTSAVPRILSSNLVVGPGPLQVSGTGCSFEYTLASETVAGPGNLMATPAFVDASGGDYHLAAGSPGIDAADPAATLTTDADGDLRPQGARADIGADEVTP